MDSELLLKFIGYFFRLPFGIDAYAFSLFLDIVCGNSCMLKCVLQKQQVTVWNQKILNRKRLSCRQAVVKSTLLSIYALATS